MRLDFQADDFGATPAVTSNITRAWQEGLLTGLSAIANGEAIGEAVDVVRSSEDGQPRMAVHLNLSEGSPLLDPAEVPVLIDESGRFHLGFLGLWRLWLGSSGQAKRRLLAQIEAEWRAQIRAVQHAFSPTPVVGIDGHVHIHMLPFLFPLAARLAREFGVREIRISHELPHRDATQTPDAALAKNLAKHVLLRSLSIRARRTAERLGLASPERVAGIMYSGRMKLDTLLAAIAAARQREVGWLEVICHPGRAAPSEVERWRGQDWLSSFYLDPRRDVEREALIGIRPHLQNGR